MLTSNHRSHPDAENQPPGLPSKLSFLKTVSSRTLSFTPLRRSSNSNTVKDPNDSLGASLGGAALESEVFDTAYSIGAGFLSWNSNNSTSASETGACVDVFHDPLSRENVSKGKEIFQNRKRSSRTVGRLDATLSHTRQTPFNTFLGLSITLPGHLVGDNSLSSNNSCSTDSEPTLDIDAASNFSFGMAADILIKLDERKKGSPILLSKLVSVEPKPKLSGNGELKPTGPSESTWRRFESHKNLRTLDTGSSLANVPSRASSTTPSLAPSVTIPEILAREDCGTNVSLLSASESLEAPSNSNIPFDFSKFENIFSSMHQDAPELTSQSRVPSLFAVQDDVSASSLTIERPLLAPSSSFASCLAPITGGAVGRPRESDVLKFTPSFLAVESSSDLLRACKDESGNCDQDDILEALRKSTIHGHLRLGDGKAGGIDEQEDSSIEYPRSSYQPLNSRSFTSVDMNSDPGSSDTEGQKSGLDPSCVAKGGGGDRKNPYLGQSVSEEGRPINSHGIGGFQFSDSETESVDRSFGSTSTVDYGILLGHRPLGDVGEVGDGLKETRDTTSEADMVDIDRAAQFLEHLKEQDEISQYEGEKGVEDEDDGTTRGRSSLSTERASQDYSGPDTTEVNNGLDMIMLLRDLDSVPDADGSDNQKRQLEEVLKGHSGPQSGTISGVAVGSSEATGAQVHSDTDPDRMIPVLDHLLSRTEAENFSLGMGASIILNYQEILEGRDPRECYSYPITKSAFDQFLEEAALYDPDLEGKDEKGKSEGEGSKEMANDGGTAAASQMITASSLWTIQEESEPEGDA